MTSLPAPPSRRFYRRNMDPGVRRFVKARDDYSGLTDLDPISPYVYPRHAEEFQRDVFRGINIVGQAFPIPID
jgi:hypothetical protein